MSQTNNNLVNHHLFKKENEPISFSEDTLVKIGELIKRYPQGREKSALLPILHIAQEELGGYLSVDVMDYVAGLLDIQPIEVYEVATFYSMFNLEKVGKYVIEVCQTGPCAITGGEAILDHLVATLNIKPGETTADGLFTLKTVECLGSCGTSPVMQINTEFYEKLTQVAVDEIIEKHRQMEGPEGPEEQKWVKKFF
jgi:NADH-quinone oxidoreductase subunit E